VKSVPLEEIRRSSLLAEKFLCDKLDWAKGIEAAQVCQDIFDKHLVPPSIDRYTCQISIWRALWMIVGNKQFVRGIL